MRRRWLACVPAVLLISVVLATPRDVARAAAPESLLAAESVVYARLDGFAGHREALDKTVLAQLLKEDLGPLVDHLSQKLMDAVGPDVIAGKLLAGAAPDELVKLQAAAGKLPHLAKFIGRRGLVVGVEALDKPLPGAQVTIVFPNGGANQNREAIFAAFGLMARLYEADVRTAEHVGRSVQQTTIYGLVHLACWQEGEHAVWTIGTAPFEHTASLLAGKRANLSSSPLLAEVAGFKHYDTYARGFVDARRAQAFVTKLVPQAGPRLAELGIDGAEHLTFHLGFEEKYQRSTIVLRTKGPRKGLLALWASAPAVDLARLPALAPDLTSMSVDRVSPRELYDRGLQTIETILQFSDPGSIEKFRAGVKEIDVQLGIDVRRDLLDALGPTIVTYSSPSDGLVGFGVTLAITLAVEVKDPAKLDKARDAIIRVVEKNAGGTFSKRRYRGADIYSYKMAQSFFPFNPAFAVHNGWLLVALNPQAIQGAVLRSGGEFSRWKPSPLLERVMRQAAQPRSADSQAARGRVVAVRQSDPRPSVQTLTTIVPFFGSLAGNENAFFKTFDFSLIPNAQAINERLTPGVSLLVDDGQTLRHETYSSLPMPVDLTGLASYGLLFGLGGFGF